MPPGQFLAYSPPTEVSRDTDVQTFPEDTNAHRVMYRAEPHGRPPIAQAKKILVCNAPRGWIGVRGSLENRQFSILNLCVFFLMVFDTNHSFGLRMKSNKLGAQRPY